MARPFSDWSPEGLPESPPPFHDPEMIVNSVVFVAKRVGKGSRTLPSQLSLIQQLASHIDQKLAVVRIF